MNRFRIGAAMLLVLLALGIWAQRWTENACTPIAGSLSEAAELAGEGSWEAAEAALDRGQRLWQESWHLTAALADHEPMEDIDALFAQLPVYAREQSEDFSSLCRELSRRIQAVADAHSLTWWNVL